MKKTSRPKFFFLLPLLFANAQAAVILPTLTLVDDLGNTPTAADVGAPSNGNTFSFAARARSNQNQNTLQIVTIADFNVSGLTVAEVNDPNFSASISFDYVGHLNNTQGAILAQLGLVASNAAPDYDLGFDDGDQGSGGVESTNALNPVTATLNGNTNASAAINDLSMGASVTQTIDVTAVIQNWVLNPASNNGFILYFDDDNASQGVYFDNLELTTIPEPTSTAILSLSLLMLVGNRRR